MTKEEYEEAVSNPQDKNPMDIIRLVAEKYNIKLRPAKKNCKRCHGRGYQGVHAGTGEPVPCPCIFEKEEFDREMGVVPRKPLNRAERRRKK